MSRTDKDRPDWVRDRDPLEDGYHTDHRHTELYPERRTVECDLAEFEAHRGPLGWFRHAHFSCSTTRLRWAYRYFTVSTPPPGWERATLYGPQRTRARAVLGELAKEFNATGEVDEDAIARREVDVRGRLPYWD